MILSKATVRLFFKVFGAIPFLFFLSNSSIAQKVLDDSTKQIHGPHTSLIYLENDVYRGVRSFQKIDTSLTNFHNYNYVYFKNNIFQNLGIIGSASQPVFKDELIKSIGYKFGMNPFAIYEADQDNFKYFDTKSPFTSVYLMEDGVGESVVKVDFAVNVNSLVNIGATYRKIISEKLLDQYVQRDRQVDSDMFTFFGSLKSKDDRYHILGNMSILSHNTLENGGYGKDTTVNWFDLKAYLAKFRTGQSSSDHLPKSFEKRTNINFYQEYDLTETKRLLAFHKFNYEDKQIGYRETIISSLGDSVIPGKFYQNDYFNPYTTDQTTRYLSVDNTLGLKSQSKQHFLSAYYTYRRFNYYQHIQSIHSDTSRINMGSSVIGGEFSARLADSLRINVQAEWQPTFAASGTNTALASHDNQNLRSQFRNNNDNRLYVGLQWKFLEVYFNHTTISPSIFQSAFTSNHFMWGNGKNLLGPVSTNEIAAKVGYSLPWHTASLKVQGQDIFNYIYFNSEALPTQYSNHFLAGYITGMATFNFWKFGLTGLVRYSKTSKKDSESPLHLPEWYVNPQFYFQTFMIKKALKIQVGVDFQYRSSYFADQYMPAIQTYFVQNKYKLDNNTMVNLFLTTQIKRIRIFIRLNNFIQPGDWLKQTTPKASQAYTNTPGYFGIPFSFVFGFNWTFFD